MTQPTSPLEPDDVVGAKGEAWQDEPGRGQIIEFPPRPVGPYPPPLSETQRVRVLWLGGAAVVAFALVGGALWWRLASPRPSSTALDLPASSAPRLPAPLSLDTAVPPAEASEPAADATGAPPNGGLSQLPAPDLAPVLATLPDDDPIMPVAPGAASPPSSTTARSGSATLVFDSGTGPGVVVAGTGPAASVIEPGAARGRDLSATVSKGTLVPAILETPIDGAKPGFVRAMVATDVRSFDGKTLLIPRSSRLSGRYTVKTTAGQQRAYVSWTRLVRPDGRSSAINAPGGGSAPLVSVVGSLATGSGKDAVRLRQGEPIRVFAARDLNLSSRR